MYDLLLPSDIKGKIKEYTSSEMYKLCLDEKRKIYTEKQKKCFCIIFHVTYIDEFLVAF